MAVNCFASVLELKYNTMSEEKDKINHIARYLNGNRDSQTLSNLNKWLAENETNQIIFDEIREIWHSLDAEEEKKRFHVNEAWAKYSLWIDQQQSDKNQSLFKRHLIQATKYAAIILVAVISTWLIYDYNFNNIQDQSFIADIPLGQTGTITLNDGSQVTLNSGSRLTSLSMGKNNERRVRLSGEAYFKVAHNPDLPFYVEVNNINIKVYGTEFNVDGYSEDSYTETTLIKGKVGILLNTGAEYIIKPNEMIRVARDNSTEIVTVPTAAQKIDWLNNMYKFKNQPLDEIAKHIERMYGMKVIIEDQLLAKEKYTGQFAKNEYIDIVLQRLVMTSPFKIDYDIKDEQITIYRN